MRTLLALAVLSLLTMSSGCKKNKDANPLGLDNKIFGEWEWVSTIGGLTGNQTSTPASTGVTTTWVFKSDSTFQQYDTRQGVSRLAESTTFSIRSARSIYTGQTTQTLRINRHVSGPTVQPATFIIQEIGTQLKIADNFPDGFGQTYHRK